MASINVDVSNFWKQFLTDLAEGVPLPESGKAHSDKDVTTHYGISKASIISLFGEKGRNYQKNWSDDEMADFNAGEPGWDNCRAIILSIMWGSRANAVTQCKSLGVNRSVFETTLAPLLDESETHLGNWTRGMAAAESLAMERFRGDFTTDVESAVGEFAAHFSGKLTHSQAKTGAMIARPDGAPLSYLYSGSLKGIAFDCAVPSSPAAAAYRKMLASAVLVHEQGREASTPIDAAIADAFDAAVDRLDTGEDRAINRSIDHRLRQIVLPRDEAYVSLTPLGAAGISAKIKDRLEDEANPERKPYAQRIDLPIGGSKVANVTDIPAATRAYLYEAPQPNVSAVGVFNRIRHRGYTLPMDRAITGALAEYVDWLEKNEFVDGRNSAKAAEIELKANKLRPIVNLVWKDLVTVSMQVREYLESLDTEPESPDDMAYEQGISLIQSKGALGAAIASGVLTEAAKGAAAKVIVSAINNKKPISLEDQGRISSNVKKLLNGRSLSC